jgi:hypothetical protein
VSSIQEYLHTVEEVHTLEKARELADNPLSKAYELSLAKCGLYERELFHPPILLECGAASLFEKLYYSWGALPYPREHAVFALQLEALGYPELAEKMAYFQQVFLDSDKNVIPSIFAQEGVRGFQESTELCHTLLESFSPPSLPSVYVAEELGLCRFSWERGCALFTTTGCMSGQGSYLLGGEGCVNFGPQTSSLGDCSRFGIVGKGKQFHFSNTAAEGISSLGELFERRYALPHLQDAKIEKQWLKMRAEIKDRQLNITGVQKAMHRPVPISYSFFLKGEACYVSKLHKLNPKSLDRYVGPPGNIEMVGHKGNMFLEWNEGIQKLEVIPLAGDESYWGADFLAFVQVDPQFSFTFNTLYRT